MRQSGTVAEGRWFSGQLRYGREKRGLPGLSSRRVPLTASAGTGERYLLFWIAGLSSPILSHRLGRRVRRERGSQPLRSPSECLPFPLSAVVASRAPRKVLGSSTSAANSTPLSSRKGKNAPCKLLHEPSQKEIRPDTTLPHTHGGVSFPEILTSQNFFLPCLLM